MGTPKYMAPEQFEGKASFASDIYAFGVMLFEMTCGRGPFVMPEEWHPAARPYFYQEAHCEQNPPEPCSLREDCPSALNDLILRCLRKNPEEWPASFREIEAELLTICREVVGKPYPRQAPEEVKLRADSLNNRAVSLYELGREEARRLWEAVLQEDSGNLRPTPIWAIFGG